eukprot:s1543_g7.t1
MTCSVYDYGTVSAKWFAVASLLQLNPWMQDPDYTEDNTHSAAFSEWARLHFLSVPPIDMQLATSTVAILLSANIIAAAKDATQQEVLPPAL